MESVKQKVSNTASAAIEHLEIFAAKTDEKVEKAMATTKEEKEIAEERRKAKEAEAKMKLHEAKARHAADKLHAKQAHLPPTTSTTVGKVVPTTGTVAPSLGGYPHARNRNI